MGNTLTSEALFEFSEEMKTEKLFGGEPKLICFVCRDNTVLSPMAEAIFRHLLADRGVCSACAADFSHSPPDIAVTSAAIEYSFGKPIASEACAALMRGGIAPSPANNYPSHRSHRIDGLTFDRAWRVVAMNGGDAMALIGEYPEYASKIVCISEGIENFEKDAENGREDERLDEAFGKLMRFAADLLFGEG